MTLICLREVCAENSSASPYKNSLLIAHLPG